MTDSHYSNDKIDLKLNKLENILLNQNTTLTRIETQVIKTNGRVTELEKINVGNKARYKIISYIVGLLLLTVSTIAGYFFNQIQTLTARQIKIFTQLNLK